MVDAATALDLPYPETAVIVEETLGDQTLVVASELPVASRDPSRLKATALTPRVWPRRTATGSTPPPRRAAATSQTRAV